MPMNDAPIEPADRVSDALMALQDRLEVRFRNPALLETALRHRSLGADETHASNERLEFLGDSVVGLVICETLYSEFPEAPEGLLSKAKAFLASEETLAEAGRRLGLPEAVRMSASEVQAGGALRKSTLADAFEAVMAAVYLDHGLPTAKRVVREALKPAFRQVARDEHHRDYKSDLQERYQAIKKVTPRYKIVNETGADHDKTFVAHVYAGRRLLGTGQGKSKKQAEQDAARAALERLHGQEDATHAEDGGG